MGNFVPTKMQKRLATHPQKPTSTEVVSLRNFDCWSRPKGLMRNRTEKNERRRVEKGELKSIS
jgi:hypothetical protein